MSALRRLSAIEANMAWHHQLHHGSTQVSTLLSIEMPLPAGRLNAAADALFHRHVLLRAFIAEASEELWFHEHADRTRITATEEACESGSAEAVLHEELNMPLDAGHALWRLRLLREPCGRLIHIVFTRHHAISDAHTTNLLLAELTQLLAGQHPAPASPMLSQGADVLWAAGRAAPQACASAPAAAPTAAGAPQPLPHFARRSPSPRTDYCLLQLDTALSAALRAHGRQHGVSVNALFGAAFARCFAREAGLERIGFATATSLRGRLIPDVVVADAGCFISVEATVLAPAQADVLETARGYKASLNAAMAAYQPPPLTHAQIRQRLAALAGQDQFGGIGITNMGVVDGACGGQGRMLRLTTVVNRNAGNAALVLHLTTLGGCFSMAFTHPRGLMDDDLVRRTVAALSRELSLLAGHQVRVA